MRSIPSQHLEEACHGPEGLCCGSILWTLCHPAGLQDQRQAAQGPRPAYEACEMAYRLEIYHATISSLYQALEPILPLPQYHGQNIVARIDMLQGNLNQVFRSQGDALGTTEGAFEHIVLEQHQIASVAF